jgi:hypothetical protein
MLKWLSLIDYYVRSWIATGLDAIIFCLCKVADFVDSRQYELDFEIDEDDELPPGFEWVDEEKKDE